MLTAAGFQEVCATCKTAHKIHHPEGSLMMSYKMSQVCSVLSLVLQNTSTWKHTIKKVHMHTGCVDFMQVIII
jgi:hypothetical protein